MQQLARVHVLERPEELVHDVLLVHVLQDVGTDHGVQVGLHVLKDQVQVAVVLGLEHVQQPARSDGGVSTKQTLVPSASARSSARASWALQGELQGIRDAAKLRHVAAEPAARRSPSKPT